MRRRALTVCLLAILLTEPMSGSAAGPIELSRDGKTVSMPVDVFRARETDLLRLEKLVETLKTQLAEERTLADRLAGQVLSLEAALQSERKAAESLQIALRGDIRKAKTTSGIIGFLAGGIVMGLVK